MLSALRPYPSARGPQALFPIMPPTVQRFEVDGSGPYRQPCGLTSFCSMACTTPGSMTAVPASMSTESTLFRYREVSITSPGPTALPAQEVPAPRPVIGNSTARPARTSSISSSVVRGVATTSGTTR